jgi:hypothetical protein
MNEPKRLLESGSTRLRALVEAGKRDAPGDHTEATVLGALGLGAAGGALLGAGAAVQTAVAQSRLVRSLVGLRRAALSKIGIGAIATATAGSAGYATGRLQERAIQREATAESAAPRAESHRVLRSLSPSNPNAASPSLPSAPSSASSLVGSALAVTPTPAVHDARPHPAGTEPSSSPVVAVDSSSGPRAAAGRADAPAAVERPPEAMAPSITAELESIRRARAFVEEGDGRAAIAVLDAYETRSPRGMFEEEEMALRVRALRITGDAAGAARELANLQSRFPKSVHLATLAR